MKTSALSTVLSIVSLAAVGVLYAKVDDLGEQLRLQRSGRAASERRGAETDPYARSDSDIASRSVVSSRTDALASPASKTPTGTVEDRLARLEQNDHERVVREKSQPRMAPMRMPRFARNVDDLAKTLKLTQSQTDRMRDSFDRAKRRIDEIMSIPGADGKSPKEAREERMRKLTEARNSPDRKPGEFFALAMRGHARLQEKIPGRNETYADEIKRVKKETRDEIGNDLSPVQKEEFGQSHVDHLMGGGGSGATQISFVSTATTDGDSGGLVVGGIEIADVEVEADE